MGLQILRPAFGSDLANALTTKYGAGVTIHYSDDNQVIFSCPMVSNKVVRIFKEQLYYASNEYMDRLNCSYGDSYTSGTTMTSPVTFCGNTRSGSSIDAIAYIDYADVVLGDQFILICFPTARSQMCLIGKATNGMFFCIGWNAEAGSSSARALPTDGTKGEIEFPVQGFPYYDSGNYIIAPVILTISGKVLKNVDDSFATIPGLYNVAHNLRVSTSAVYIAPPVWYNNANSYSASQFPTCLFMPLG